MNDPVPAPDRWILRQFLKREATFGVEPAASYGSNLPFDLSDPEAHWPVEVRQANAQPGNRFGHFVLVAQVGCGDSGTVFRAWDAAWGRYAAVKIFHALNSEEIERLTAATRA